MAGNPLTNPNWAPELADTVERLVTRVRDTATTRVVVVVRAVVFGVVVGCAAIAAAVLGIILGTKFLQALLTLGDAIDADTSVWVSYLVMGGILLIAGMFFMHKRETPDAKVAT